MCKKALTKLVTLFEKVYQKKNQTVPEINKTNYQNQKHKKWVKQYISTAKEKIHELENITQSYKKQKI